MGKNTVSLVLLSLLLLAGFAECIPTVSADNAPLPLGYDPKHLIVDTIGEPESLDPAWAYDTASAELIMNVYETLVAFDVDYTRGPYEAGRMDQFAPKLATGWSYQTINEYDPVSGSTYLRRFIFNLRFTNASGQPIRFHNGDALTAEDVEYSFERWMVQDRSGGPTWMIYRPLLNTYGSVPPSGPGGDPNWGIRIDRAVQRNSTSVWFNFVTTFPEVTFLQIISQAWASVVDRAWCIASGDLDISQVVGGWANWAYIYNRWNNPAASSIGGKMMGTGPYEFVYWNLSDSWQIKRFGNYWDVWPARVRWNTDERIGGYLDQVTWCVITGWTTRRDRFLAGDSDLTVVPRCYRDQVLGQSVAGEKVKCFYPFDTLALDAFFFTLNINPASPYMGVAGGLPPSTFSQSGIPPDIFSDRNVRLGIAYIFDYQGWLEDAYLGEGWQPSDYIVSWLSYDNPAQQAYSYNVTLARQCLQAAWGGDLWQNGMRFTIVYNVGNKPRQTAAEMLRDQLNAINAQFRVYVIGVSWGSEYLSRLVSGQLPIFLIGWLADFPDPHNFAFPFAHSLGTFAAYQGYNNPVVDALIDAGTQMADDATPYPIPGEQKWLDVPNPRRRITNATGTFGFNNWPSTPYTNLAQWLANPPDTRWPKRSIYYALQSIYYDDVPSVPLVQALGRHFEQQWVRGWYYNPIYGGSPTPGIDSTAPATPALYAYHLWKAVTHYGDVNNDGQVDLLDVASISAYWYSPPSVGPLGYAPQADITGGKGGTTGTESGYVKAIPDGRVNIVDVGLLKAYFDDPKGPVHP